jgi:hypothetical protein
MFVTVATNFSGREKAMGCDDGLREHAQELDAMDETTKDVVTQLEPFVRVNPTCKIRLSAVTGIYIAERRLDWVRTDREYFEYNTVWLIVVGFSKDVELQDPYKMDVLRRLGELPEDPKAQQEHDDANCVGQD